VFAQSLHPITMAALARSAVRVVYDLYTPFVSENLAFFRDNPPVGRAAVRAFTIANQIQRVALATGDAFVCASDRQRDLWLGALTALGRVRVETYLGDPTLRNAVDVVPFGCPAEPPVKTAQVMKGVVPGIRDTDRVLLWAGGVWNWFDPLTVIRAVAELARDRDDVKLYFLGLAHPSPTAREMRVATAAVALAQDLGVRDRFVFFNHGWMPYAERVDYLLEADAGVCAHFDDVETRFAFRTRVLDHFWAGLPTITTEGDVLADLVVRRGLGRCVREQDVDGWVRAITAVLEPGEAERVRANLEPVRQELSWPALAGRLEQMLTAAGAALGPPDISARRLVRRYAWQVGTAVAAERGVIGMVREGVANRRAPRVP
jgi:glycosyltransferase involved in cell wall biosynthesis